MTTTDHATTVANPTADTTTPVAFLRFRLSPRARATAPRSVKSARPGGQVAEAAREQDWTRPSFAKELYLGVRLSA